MSSNYVEYVFVCQDGSKFYEMVEQSEGFSQVFQFMRMHNAVSAFPVQTEIAYANYEKSSKLLARCGDVIEKLLGTCALNLDDQEAGDIAVCEEAQGLLDTLALARGEVRS